MRQHISYGINLKLLLIPFIILLLIGVGKKIDEELVNSMLWTIVEPIITNDIIFLILFFLLPLLFCDRIIVDREGIKRIMLLAPITMKSKTWREIKHYANVTETWSGRYGNTSSVDCLWFIDFNDKVCLRIQKGTRHNLDKILGSIERFEDKLDINLEVKDPYRMAFGWSKVKYPEKEGAKKA